MTDAVTVADVLGKTGPALSATSDMPVITPAPETPPPAAEEKPEAQPEAKPEGDAPAAEAEPETPTEPKKDGISERFSKVTADRRAAEQRADKLADSLDKAIATIERLTPKGETAQPKPSAETKPRRETFDNPEAYESALIEWAGKGAAEVARSEIKKEQEAADTKAREEKQRQDNEALQKSWNDKLVKSKEKHPDFDEVVAREDVIVTHAMTRVMLESDVGAEIGYFFGQHPEEAARIAAIQSPVLQAMEMGRLAASLAEKPNVSRTPPPIKPIGTRANAGPKSPDEMSMEEYAAQRTSQLRAARSGARH